MSQLESRLQKVESVLDTLTGQLEAWREQRDSDRDAATKDNDRRFDAQMRRLDEIRSELRTMNGSVRENRERIIRVETHQQRSKEDKDRRAQTDPVTEKVSSKVRPEYQWAAAGGLLVPGVLYIMQKMAEAIATLAAKIPIGP